MYIVVWNQSGCFSNQLCIDMVKILAYGMAYALLSPDLREYLLFKCILSYFWYLILYQVFSIALLLSYVLLDIFFVGYSYFRSIVVVSFRLLVESCIP